jgi:hypothetical protein
MPTAKPIKTTMAAPLEAKASIRFSDSGSAAGLVGFGLGKAMPARASFSLTLSTLAGFITPL